MLRQRIGGYKTEHKTLVLMNVEKVFSLRVFHQGKTKMYRQMKVEMEFFPTSHSHYIERENNETKNFSNIHSFVMCIGK